MLRPFWRLLLLIWIVTLLLGISWPWSKFDGTPHWERVHWVPFQHVRLTPSLLSDFEFMANIFVFVPLGFLIIRSFPPKSAGTWRALLPALLVGGLCSFGLEIYQLFCHDRVPSVTDVINNVSGTVLGAGIALWGGYLLHSSAVRLRRHS